MQRHGIVLDTIGTTYTHQQSRHVERDKNERNENKKMKLEQKIESVVPPRRRKAFNETLLSPAHLHDVGWNQVSFSPMTLRQKHRQARAVYQKLCGKQRIHRDFDSCMPFMRTFDWGPTAHCVFVYGEHMHVMQLANDSAGPRSRHGCRYVS